MADRCECDRLKPAQCVLESQTFLSSMADTCRQNLIKQRPRGHVRDGKRLLSNLRITGMIGVPGVCDLCPLLCLRSSGSWSPLRR